MPKEPKASLFLYANLWEDLNDSNVFESKFLVENSKAT